MGQISRKVQELRSIPLLAKVLNYCRMSPYFESSCVNNLFNNITSFAMSTINTTKYLCKYQELGKKETSVALIRRWKVSSDAK